MTDQASTTDQASKSRVGRRSRRQLLTRGAGTLAAVLTAETLARPVPAAAADGNPVTLGQLNTETTLTEITNSTDNANTLRCSARGSGDAVQAVSDSGAGVSGNSGPGVGVQGVTNNGTGVMGLSTSGIAMVGKSQGFGDGVHGEAPLGIGVKATGKTALQVNGPAVFNRSGIVTVAAGHSTVTNTGIALTAASLVLATIQGNVAGVFVQGVTRVTGSSGSFTIHLNKTVSKSVKVAWFAIN